MTSGSKNFDCVVLLTYLMLQMYIDLVERFNFASEFFPIRVLFQLLEMLVLSGCMEGRWNLVC
jgi:hypothetical protein